MLYSDPDNQEWLNVTRRDRLNINDAFPSKFLKADDLRGKQVTCAIDNVLVEEVGDDNKPVVYFVGRDKGLACNKTNAMVIAGAYGPETEGWAGKEIVLRSEKVSFQGKIVDSIRVHIPLNEASEADVPF